MAVANTIEAMKSGCLYADTTLMGIGERAGNCDFAQLVAASNSLFDWGISPPAARKLEDEFSEIIRLPRKVRYQDGELSRVRGQAGAASQWGVRGGREVFVLSRGTA
jgi:isopropylmalate/homocitrate/citramalate synthase